jgi:hypothetical protein
VRSARNFLKITYHLFFDGTLGSEQPISPETIM